MTDSYPQRVRENILPLSVAGALPEAFLEWHFTGCTEDHEEPVETCQLCDQEDLRYHFEIKNENTGSRLWVGSQCILKFDVAVYEQGRVLDQKEAKRKLAKLTEKMRLDSCIKALEQVAEREDNKILRNALEYYQKNKYLTPKFAFVVFWRLAENGIDHSPSFFKVSLRRDRYKEDVKGMPTSRVHLIWPALTSAQRKKVCELGHTPPEKT